MTNFHYFPLLKSKTIKFVISGPDTGSSLRLEVCSQTLLEHIGVG